MLTKDQLRGKVLEFLYSQVNQGKIPQIKKGQVEDLEEFIDKILADQEIGKVSDAMVQKAINKEPK